MSVYKEGFAIVEMLERNQAAIYNDAADCGVFTKFKDATWKAVVQLVEWYAVKGTRKATNAGPTTTIKLIDEWAVSDERLSINDATILYQVTYTTILDPFNPSLVQKGCNGFFTIQKIEK
jgi:hypothetical protein